MSRFASVLLPATLAVVAAFGAAAQGVTLTRSVSPGAFLPGGAVEVTLTINYTGSLRMTALGGEEDIPPGWTLAGFSGPNLPGSRLINPDTGLLEYAYFNQGAFPLSFTYRLTVPEGDFADHVITGRVRYRLNAGELTTPELSSPVFYDAPPDATIALTRTVAPEVYTPGGPVVVTVTISHDGGGIITGMVLRESLPEGWTPEAPTGGCVPNLVTIDPRTNVLRLGHTETPEFPCSFSYRVTPPASASANAQITGVVRFRLNGQERSSAEVATDIAAPEVPGGCRGCAREGAQKLGVPFADIFLALLALAALAGLSRRM